MEDYIFPKPKSVITEDAFFQFSEEMEPACSVHRGKYFSSLPAAFQPKGAAILEDFVYSLGKTGVNQGEIGVQGYYLKITQDGILLKAKDLCGYLYGIDTLNQIIRQSPGKVKCLEIEDEPVLKNRGLMVDLSRGRVYTRDYLLNLVELLAKMRMNILQFYVEHTFEFKNHVDIHKGSGPLTAEDILAVQDKCEEYGIELQANLQSLGHMNRILTREKYMDLSESDLFWSLDTTSEESYRLLDELYSEYLPLFKSDYVNVCSDEPYDLGKGKSRKSGLDTGELYYNHILRIREIAAKYNKKLMIFGDVIKEHSEFAKKLPDDMVYLDWIYDPKAHYGTPEIFKETGRPYWVSPGTGNWNTLFPRLDGSMTNIVNLITEGIKFGTEGMLLTDWNDHGGYGQPGPAYYTYAYAAAVSYRGEDPGRESISRWIDHILDLEGFGDAVIKLSGIYRLPPMWSKNRSQCVMALFDEPIRGNTLCGQKPPENLTAYELSLPEGVDYIFERHSQHPLRPHFSIPLETVGEIRKIAEDAEKNIIQFREGPVRNQMLYITEAFTLLCDKILLSHGIITSMKGEDLTARDFIKMEDQLRVMISRYTDLQLNYVEIWHEVAKRSELYISLTYFAHIISRLDYLRDWVSIQRENLVKGEDVDWTFKTYNTGDYTTLPTY